MARYDLAGKVALVTGGARGIGFATGRALVARGASVVVVDLDAEAAQAAAARLHDSRAIGLAADVADRGAIHQAVAASVDRLLGGLDVVVANAGIGPTYATLRATAVETFDRVIDVNLTGVVNTVRAALPEVTRNAGHVVLVASVYAFQNGVGVASYAMSKAGVEQLGRALRLELVPHGASASVAYFGLIDTELVHQTIDADPAVNQMFGVLPKALLKRLQPDAAGEAIAVGIERRQPRIIRPALRRRLRAPRPPWADERPDHGQRQTCRGGRPRLRRSDWRATAYDGLTSSAGCRFDREGAVRVGGFAPEQRHHRAIAATLLLSERACSSSAARRLDEPSIRGEARRAQAATRCRKPRTCRCRRTRPMTCQPPESRALWGSTARALDINGVFGPGQTAGRRNRVCQT